MLRTLRAGHAKLKWLFGPLPLLFLMAFLSVSTITRCILTIDAHENVDRMTLPLTFALGFVFDLAAASWALLPIVATNLILPSAWRSSRWVQALALAMLATTLYLMCFDLVAELLFWREFGVRFNFIAVDYLVYTHEVIGNIRESYPVGTILFSLLAPTLLSAASLRRVLQRSLTDAIPLGTRLRQGAVWILLIALGAYACSPELARRLPNRFNAELAGNGLYSLFASFRENELDYGRFYATLPSPRVSAILEDLLNARAQGVQQPRRIATGAPERRLNVVLISVESLSAEFLGRFGNAQELTPNLDRIAEKSLVFTRLYATGTRTVRGLEALTLSLPPTPGQSIVKRPHNAHLFSLGSVFRNKGYDVRYVYGGYGYFDNMNAFFSGNGYQVVDRVAIPQQRIPFENIWGVADEALFDQTLEELDRSHRAGRHSFTHVMTTSNHRPYTYPDGRIDIASHTGREGGVKYTDYAIGRFLKQAEHRPWFRDTVFVIVADHCASSAGKTELPLKNYHIPLLVYAPHHIAPRTVDRLASQIDIGPTILGLLGFSYPSRFLGQDILHTPVERDRAFVSTYQALGYLKNNVLTVLRPRRQVEAFRIDAQGDARPARVDLHLLDEAIAYYQGASELYKTGHYRALP